MDALIEAWEICARINLYLLDSLTDSQWMAKPEKGRANDAQFAHLHNVRLMWIKVIDPELHAQMTKLEAPYDRVAVRATLESSAAAMSTVLRSVADPAGRVKGFKPHAAAFVGYLISHESHHRGMIELGLRQAGLPIDDKISYGMWEWGVR